MTRVWTLQLKPHQVSDHNKASSFMVLEPDLCEITVTWKWVALDPNLTLKYHLMPPKNLSSQLICLIALFTLFTSISCFIHVERVVESRKRSPDRRNRSKGHQIVAIIPKVTMSSAYKFGENTALGLHGYNLSSLSEGNRWYLPFKFIWMGPKNLLKCKFICTVSN